MSFSPSGGTASYLKDIPRERIQRLTIQDEWYLDDFGGVGDLVAGGLRGGAPPPDTRRPVDTPSPADAPPAGSPDGPAGDPDAVPPAPDAVPVPAPLPESPGSPG
jgi:hypothetical protein